jgi:hypothetical protein
MWWPSPHLPLACRLDPAFDSPLSKLGLVTNDVQTVTGSTPTLTGGRAEGTEQTGAQGERGHAASPSFDSSYAAAQPCHHGWAPHIRGWCSSASHTTPPAFCAPGLEISCPFYSPSHPSPAAFALMHRKGLSGLGVTEAEGGPLIGNLSMSDLRGLTPDRCCC